MIKELCVESYLEAKKGELKGANRIELCENLSVGGTTPSYGTIKLCIEKLNIPTFVMIRPRGGDFVYSSEEIEIMKEDIKICKKLGVKGIVLGVLTNDNTINYDVLSELLKEAGEMEVTFHKAIDQVLEMEKEVKKLENIGISRILTSGGKATAKEGSIVINKMINSSNYIKIVAAGKITKDNLENISKDIKTTEFHGKAIV